MSNRRERIELLADELLVAAMATTADPTIARARANRALDRILERDPALARLSWILAALDQAREACLAGRAGAAWGQTDAFMHA